MKVRNLPILQTGFGKAQRAGILATLALLGTGVGWAAVTDVSGAIIAIGTVEVSGRPKSVQHLDGGVIEEILVTNGQSVAKGDVLIRLDGTMLQANLRIYRTRLSEALAERDRLTAEQDGQPNLVFGPIDVMLTPEYVTQPRAAQTALFKARRDLERGSQDQLAERILQFENQTIGLTGLIAAKQQQLDLIEEELDTLVNLSEKGLVRAPQVMAARRQQADLLGQLAELGSALARTRNSIRDAEMEVLQGQRQRYEAVVDALGGMTPLIFELRQQIEATEKQLKRIAIRAPNSGRIHELQFTTIGGVVPAGATILQIIPLDQGVSFRARVAPVSVDQIFAGQPAILRFPAFDRRETPELHATLVDISPTSVVDPASGQSFFWVTLQVSASELARLGALQLVPGMPVEAYLKTGDRTVLTYLTKPVTDQIFHAFREE